jgi:hypothetical protein
MIRKRVMTIAPVAWLNEGLGSIGLHKAGGSCWWHCSTRWCSSTSTGVYGVLGIDLCLGHNSRWAMLWHFCATGEGFDFWVVATPGSDICERGGAEQCIMRAETHNNLSDCMGVLPYC